MNNQPKESEQPKVKISQLKKIIQQDARKQLDNLYL